MGGLLFSFVSVEVRRPLDRLVEEDLMVAVGLEVLRLDPYLYRLERTGAEIWQKQLHDLVCNGRGLAECSGDGNCSDCPVPDGISNLDAVPRDNGDFVRF